jgi:hypothetical protein
VASDEANPLGWLVPAEKPLTFHARTRHGVVEVAPLNTIQGERYAVYWQTEEAARGAG